MTSWRIVVVLVTAMVLLVAAFVTVSRIWGTTAIQAAQPTYEMRKLFGSQAKRHDPERPLVAWLGDSTLIRWEGMSNYPDILEERSEATDHPIECFTQAAFGLDQYVHYMVLERALALEPSAVFVVVNLRLLGPTGAGRKILQLAPMIPRHELPRSALLPWYARSITWPRLLLARGLASQTVSRAVYTLEGLRILFRDRIHTTNPKISWVESSRSLGKNLRMYDTPISERSPSVEMLAATVERVERRGIPAVAVVVPVPVAILQSKGLLSPQIPDRIDALRQSVEGSGGELIDLSRALEMDDFRDKSGHYNEQGFAKMADLMQPVVERVLRAR